MKYNALSYWNSLKYKEKDNNNTGFFISVLGRYEVKDMINDKICDNDIHVLLKKTHWNNCIMSEDLIISGVVFLRLIWSGYLL